MDRVPLIEILETAQQLEDGACLVCKFDLTSRVDLEIEVNNQGLVSSVRLVSPERSGMTITEVCDIFRIQKHVAWEVIKTIRYGGLDPRYP